MTRKPEPLDTASKGWLAMLVVASLAFVGILAYGYMKVASPTDECCITTDPPAPEQSREVQISNEPSWSYPEPLGSGGTAAASAASLSTNSAAWRQQNAATKALVHQQTEGFRKMVNAGTLPEGLGNLTQEQIDEMEKNNIVVW